MRHQINIVNIFMMRVFSDTNAKETKSLAEKYTFRWKNRNIFIMSSNGNSQNNHSTRKVGNIFLSWKIHNFWFTYAIPDCRIISPVFHARGPRTTTWQLILEPFSKVNTNRHFTFQLSRLDSDPAATVLWIDWKIAFMTVEDSPLCGQRGQCFFAGRGMFKNALSGAAAANVYKGLNRFGSDTLLVYFQIVVSRKEANNNFEGTSDVGLSSLSRDLLALYKRGMWSDVVIRMRDKSIPAHKAILQCRSPYFKKLFEQYRKKDVFDITEFSYKTVNNMLSYLYSGKLQFVLGIPSIEMYDCAVRFQIREVIQYYALDTFPMESKIHVLDIFDVWRINTHETSSEQCVECEMSPEAVTNLTGHLSMFPRGKDGKCNSACVFAEFRRSDKKQQIICLELGIMACDKKVGLVSKEMGILEDSIVLEFHNLPHSVIISNIFDNGAFNIAAKLRIADTEVSWKTFGTQSLNSFSNPSEIEHSYSRLSKDIKSLLTSSLYSDITFVSKCKDFEVHKCILAARSPTFHKQIREWNPVYLSCETVNVKSHIMSILMEYLYSGILNNCNISDAAELCDAADGCILPILKIVISRILQ